MKKLGKIKLIILDLDGTVVDSRNDITTAINYTLEQYKIPPKTMEEVSNYVGGGFEETLKKSFGKNDYDEKALGIFKDYYKNNCTVETETYPGIYEFLELSSKYYKTTILTNKDHEVTACILKELDIEKYLDEYIGISGFEYKKPDPHYINYYLQKYSVKPDEAIIIGDMPVDIKTGRNAGIKTCIVTYGLGDLGRINELKPDLLIDSISELKEILIF